MRCLCSCRAIDTSILSKSVSGVSFFLKSLSSYILQNNKLCIKFNSVKQDLLKYYNNKTITYIN